MKTILFLALLGVSAQAQNIFLLGSNTTPPPDLSGQAASQVIVTQPANNCAYAAAPAYGYPSYYDPYYPQYQHPNVMYIGGPGTCGPNFYYYPRYNTESVIYFGGLQAARHGYNFRYCR